MLDLLGTHHLFSKKTESAYASVEYNFTNSYFDSPQQFKRLNGLLKYTGQLSDNTSLTLFGSYFTSSWDASGQIPDRAVSKGLISRFGSLDSSEGGNTNRSNLYATFTTALPHDAVLRQQVYYSHYFFNLYSNFTFFKNDPLNGDGINQRDTGRSLYGYTGTYERDDQLSGRSLYTTFGLGTRLDNAGLLLRHVTQRVPLDTFNIGRLYEQNGNAYLDETLTLTDRLTLNAALRADLFIYQFWGQRADSAAGFVPLAGRVVRGRVSPKLNLYYQLSPAVQLFARSGLGFHSK
jgi:hypothetical protein